MSAPSFADRAAAGRALGRRLQEYAGPQTLVLGLPRGGVPVAAEVATALDADLDVLVVRKLGVPRQPELAFGAIAGGGVRVLNPDVVAAAGMRADEIERITITERGELERRERLYRGDRPPPSLAGRTVILVDDGLATGATMRSAVRAVRTATPARVVVAVPVGAAESVALLSRDADAVVTVLTPETFVAVGQWYDDFRQTTDEEVRELLTR